MHAKVKPQFWTPVRERLSSREFGNRERADFIARVVAEVVAMSRRTNGKHTCKSHPALHTDMDTTSALFLAWDNIEYVTRAALANHVALKLLDEHDQKFGKLEVKP